MSDKQGVQAYFNTVSQDWDRLRQNYYGVEVIEKSLEAAGLKEVATVANATDGQAAELLVDVGCGTGFLTAGLAPYARKVIGVDDSPGMLAVAVENVQKLGLTNVELKLGSVSELPLANGQADAIFANMVLHHAPDPQLMLTEMARIIRPDGKVIITDMETHSHEWFKVEMADVWLGFDEVQLQQFMAGAGLADFKFGWVGTQ